MRIVFIIVSVMMAAAIPAADSPSGLSLNGYGRIRFGMTIAEAETAVHAAADRRGGNDSCGFMDFAPYPGVKFMVENGRITRADLPDDAPNVVGIRVGMTLQEVRRRFPHAKVTEKSPDDVGHRIVFRSSNGKTEIIADEERLVVTRIRGGLIPSAEYTEGCN